jgi:isopentenyl diphosphate isomerase/L-lactate dehydrogenase-like FMN-dependent dehydrogenase
VEGGHDQSRQEASTAAVPLSVRDYERLAEEQLAPDCLGYFAGGACDEWTLRENIEAFSRLHLRPRVLRGIDQVEPGTTVLGLELGFPLLVAPVGFMRKAHPDGEPAAARAAEATGAGFCLSTLATASAGEIAAAAPSVRRAFQVYVFRDHGFTDELVAAAIDAGFDALLLTVDLPVLGRRERELRGGWATPEDMVPSIRDALGRGAWQPGELSLDPGLDWPYLERLCGSVDVPVAVKGVLTADDALLAADHGAAGVVVSNHGGRQLDGVAASIDVLPEVADAVGDRLDVLVDGGVRRGTDVVKALALGAKAVLAGRAPVWGLAAAGEEGARAVLALLREEVEIALALLGCRTPGDVTPEHVLRSHG